MSSSGKSSRPSSLHTKGTSVFPFANDPVRSQPVPLLQEDIQPLQGKKFLSTHLVDFILQQTMKESVPEDVLIGTSLSMMYFDMMNTKRFMKKHLDIIRRKYLPYSANGFQILFANCTNSHIFVMQLTFDDRNRAIFENFTVYECMRGGSANNEVYNRWEASTPVLEVFPCNEKLLNHPELILQNAVSAD
jgi:hypothetical protein